MSENKIKRSNKKSYGFSPFNISVICVVIYILIEYLKMLGDPSTEGWFYTVLLIFLILAIPVIAADVILQFMISDRWNMMKVEFAIVLIAVLAMFFTSSIS